MSGAAAQGAGGGQSLCFVVDTDFGYLQGFSKSLRGLGVNTVEFVNSARLGDSVENLSPDIVFLSVSATDPYDCMRALLTLKDCRFGGRVQIFGKGELPYLEAFRKVGNDAALSMLPVLQKPVDFATVRKVIREQKLKTEAVSPPDVSLKKALANNWISFLYQPQVDLKSRTVVSAESFVRVAHPQHGLLPPASFMGGAAEEDLTTLATQAIVNAVETSARFFNSGVFLKFAINVNVETLAKLPVALLVEKFRPADEQWPGIILDMNETQVLTKVAMVKSRLGPLQQVGVELALDNFGRGNSSLAMFKELPFCDVKIDRSFVDGCSGDRNSLAVCKTVVELAHNFRSKATAVGIETDKDADMLARLGCDIGQGYLFGKPMSEQELMGLVAVARTGAPQADGAALALGSA
jgi:EAL domain-containing protein (putative c-di-GMP-specific phosphodiesterase class I)